MAGDAAVMKDYERAMRGYYRLQGQNEEGGIGSISKNGQISDSTRILFKGLVTDPLPVEAESGQGRPISPF
jgi:hypothetical protein